MANNAQLHVGDTATALRFVISDEDDEVVDLSAAVIRLILMKPFPNRNKVTLTPVLVTDGTDGAIQYVTLSSTLDVAGIWSAQVYVIIGTGSWRTNIVTFEVKPNL